MKEYIVHITLTCHITACSSKIVLCLLDIAMLIHSLILKTEYQYSYLGKLLEERSNKPEFGNVLSCDMWMAVPHPGIWPPGFCT